MHICYIDESGTPQIPGNTSHFVLAGLAIPVEQWKLCESSIHDLKKDYDLQGSEIHTGWMLRPYQEQQKIKNFSSLNKDERKRQVTVYRNKELLRLQKTNRKLLKQVKKNNRQTKSYIHLTRKERTEFIHKLAELIGTWDFARLFAECIDKVYFNPSIHKTTVEEQSFEQIVSRFEQYLQITSSATCTNMGMLIHDNNEAVASRLTALMKTFYRKGTLWTKIKNTIETPLFVNSELSSMVQIADLCSYALKRYLENGEKKLFNHIYRRADRKDGKVVGVRHWVDQSCRCIICKSRF
jgi:hypothetical protein